MSIKQKLLDALNLTLDDVNEERLIDIILDSYTDKQKQIVELRGENAQEREMIRREYDRMQDERRKMRSDPLYCAAGDYFFLSDGVKIRVHIQGYKINVLKKVGDIEYMTLQCTPKEWKD